MRGRQNRTTALQQHAATYSTVLLFSVATQIWILNKEIPTMLHCMMRLPLHRAKDPQQHLFCQFVMRCSASNCAAGLPKLPPTPFFHSRPLSPPVYMSVHLKALEKISGCFQGSEWNMDSSRKTSQRLQPVWQVGGTKSWLCVWKARGYCNRKQFGREMVTK